MGPRVLLVTIRKQSCPHWASGELSRGLALICMHTVKYHPRACFIVHRWFSNINPDTEYLFGLTSRPLETLKNAVLLPITEQKALPQVLCPLHSQSSG